MPDAGMPGAPLLRRHLPFHGKRDVGGNRPAQPRVVDVDPRDATAAVVRRDAAPRRLDFG